MRKLVIRRDDFISLIRSLKARSDELAVSCKYDRGLLAIPLFVNSDYTIRLNIISEVFAELPHQHRQAFCATIVQGGYEHRTYELPPNLLGDACFKLTLAHSTLCRAGDSYYISEKLLHDTLPLAPTISLFARKPSFSRNASSLNIDLSKKQTWFHTEEYYRTVDPSLQPKAMEPAELHKAIEQAEISLTA